jgi:hypothetical protein
MVQLCRRFLSLSLTIWLLVMFFIPISIHAQLERSDSDRPDDTTDYQIHIMYVLPSDGIDENLDTNGTLVRSVAAFQNWLAEQTGGRKLRVDTYQGQLDITFWRLKQTDTKIASTGVRVRGRLESALRAAGFNKRRKIYAVYYAGTSTDRCGWAMLRGNYVALFLRGTPPGAPPCATNAFASSVSTPGYLEFSMLHEIFHALGAVAACAPHYTSGGHVSDDPHDLMYAGDQNWYPSILDKDRDDYYGHKNARCLDVAKSPFFEK